MVLCYVHSTVYEVLCLYYTEDDTSKMRMKDIHLRTHYNLLSNKRHVTLHILIEQDLLFHISGEREKYFITIGANCDKSLFTTYCNFLPLTFGN